MDAVAEIKSRISIEDLVAQYVPLKKVGRQLKALCPFHKERTPSFYVSPERQIAYCFGCHKGGDIFKFTEEIEGLDFSGALKFLAEKAGVVLPNKSDFHFNKETKTERDRLISIHSEATEFFEDQLWKTDGGKKVLEYIRKRGVKDETIHSHRLGFAQDSRENGGNSLFKHLLEKGFTRAEILASGLVIAKDTNQDECFDRFRSRLMFPIQNLAGDICAFGGRALREGDEPKYLNSPETSIYHKSSLLYGLASGRAEIRRTNSVLVVEGYMDALSAHQVGVLNAVACSGTSFTEDQLATLKRFTPEIIFAFDRDNAGKLATLRAIEMTLPQDFAIRVAVWESDAKDPDECIKKSPELFLESVKNAKPAFLYLFEYFESSFDKTSAAGKKKIMDSLLPFLTKVKSSVLLDGWLKDLSSRFDLSLNSLYDEFKSFSGRQKVQNRPAPSSGIGPESARETAKQSKGEEYLLGILLTHTDSYFLANQILTPEDFEDSELQNIYRSLTTQYNQQLDEKEKQRASVCAMLAESLHSEMAKEDVQQEVVKLVHYIALRKIEKEKRDIVRKLKMASGAEKNSFLETYQELLAREDKLVGGGKQ